MLGGLSTAFLNKCVPLWFALVMGFTAPYLWSGYVKKAANDLYQRHFGSEDE